MRVLVTGATGFVGRHLLPVLQQGGCQVRAAYRSDRSTNARDTLFEWVPVGDIGPDTSWAGAMAGVDVVIHLAALAHQMGPAAETRESEFLRVNALGTAQLAECAAEAGVSRFVMLSSIAAMGPYADEPLAETGPCTPVTPYGRSKLEGERAVQRLLADGPTDWCILRPPLIYGPGNPGNMARLLRLIERGLPLPLGRVEARRSYVYVGNLVDLLSRCLTHPGASRRVFVVDDGEPIATRALVRLLAKYAGKPARLLPVPPWALKALGRLGDQLQRILGSSAGIDSYSIDRLMGSLVVDSRAVREALGWSPPFSQEAGLRLTVQPELEAA